MKIETFHAKNKIMVVKFLIASSLSTGDFNLIMLFVFINHQSKGDFSIQSNNKNILFTFFK